MIEKISAIATIGFDPTVALVQRSIETSVYQREIGPRRCTTIGPVLSVMAVGIAAVRAT